MSEQTEETPKKKILIVDDEAPFTRLVRMNLEATKRYEVREVNQAQRAISVAKEFEPDLMLLDVIMPGMDGGELASRIKSNRALKDVPVIFLTATVGKKEAGEDGIESGGYLFLAKPINAKKLMETIDGALDK